MRTLTVNFKIVTSAPGDENLSVVVASVLRQMAEHALIQNGTYKSGDEFTFRYTKPATSEVLVWTSFEGQEQARGKIVDFPEQTFEVKVIATYENQ